MKKNPVVTIITPLFNAEQFIEKQMLSVLKQTYKELEFIIVDDCSKDNSRKIVDKFDDDRIIIIENEKNEGIVYSTNKGLERATGDYVIFLDDDEIIPVTRIEQQVEYMEKNKAIGIVVGETLSINTEGRIIGENTIHFSSSDEICASLLFHDCICNGSTMIRTKHIKDNNLKIRDSSYGMQDFRFYIEMSKICQFGVIHQISLFHRQHEANATKLIKQDHKIERSLKFAEYQNYAIKNHGFELLDTEQRIINKLLPECVSNSYIEKEFFQLISVFNKIREQNRKIHAFKQKDLDYVLRFELYRLINNGNMKLDKVYSINKELLQFKGVSFYRNLSQTKENQHYNVALVGIGKIFNNIVFDEIFSQLNIIGLYDNDEKKWGKMSYGLEIMPIHAIREFECDYIVIMTKYIEELRKQLLAMGYAENKILSYEELFELKYKDLSVQYSVV